jgi:hypothetical protein
MRVVHIEETVPAGTTLRLHHICDTHLGAPDVDEDALKQRIAMIDDDPWARWTFGGDMGDLIRFNDRRYQPTEIHPRYRQAADLKYATLEHAETLFKPIAGKMWGFCDGNHEKKYDDHYGGKFGVELCCNLGVERRYAGYRGFVHVTFKLTKTQKVAQLIDLQHGWQAGRSQGAFYNQASKELSYTEADIVLRGHSHKPGGVSFPTLGVTADTKRVQRRHRTVINGGCWRYGYRDNLAPIDRERLSEVEGDLWSETKGFAAELMGGPVLLLRFQHGNSDGRRGRRGYPSGTLHTLVEGEITADTLGLAA